MSTRYLLARTGVMLLTLAALLAIQFFIFRLMPGDPTASILAGGMTPEIQAELQRLWGLDKPLANQFIDYALNLLRLDFGISFYKNVPVVEVVLPRLGNTLVFMVTAMIWANVVGAFLGVAAVALRRFRVLEGLMLFVGSVARATPLFVTGILLILIFSYYFEWFPLGGMHKVGTVHYSLWDKYMSLDFLHHLALPTLVAGIFYFTTPFFVMRASMLSHLKDHHLSLARAKGAPPTWILTRHVARNALNPVITTTVLSLGFAVGGQVVVETIFRWPGLGSELVFSTLRRDYPVVQAIFFLISSMVILMNYLADLIYLLLDPRVRYEQGR